MDLAVEEKKREPLKMPPSTITITIGPNSYDIKIPNNGQLIDIETRKAKLTEGTHSQMLFGSNSSQQAYLLVEVIATLSVLAPELNKHVNVANLLEMNPIDTKQIVKEYTTKVHPWLIQIREVANEDIDSK